MLKPTMVDAALAYAAQGIRVLPASPGNSHGKNVKEPLATRGVHSATTDEATIRSWFTLWPNACLAIACGCPIVIVDCDRHVGQADGIAALESLRAEGFVIPDDAPRASTAGGGLHIWLRAPQGMSVKSRKFAPGIDLLSHGKYALCAPSVLDDGRRYRFLAPKEALDA